MKKNKSFFESKTLLTLIIAAGSLAFNSCAQDGYDDDERWDNGVYNTQLESPAADDITITPSADESKTTISWPVVYGAGGYVCSVYDVSDPNNPTVVDEVEDSLIDGCSLAISREEDVKYKFTIRTAGNEEHNNAGAETTTEVAFNSMTITTATLPDGCDIADWFEQNQIPAEATKDMHYYNLAAGGTYTLSRDIDFLANKITLRTEAKNNPAKITLSDGASFRTYSAFSLKYTDVDMSASSKALVIMSSTPDDAIKGATGTGDYYNDQNAVVIDRCNIEGVNGNLIYDDGLKYCLEQLVIKKSVVHLTTNTKVPTIYFKGGFVNNLSIESSTIWSTGSADANYFVQYNNNGRCSRAGYTTNSITYTNCTFYNVAKSGQIGNYGGFSGQKTSVYTLTDNIFVDCGSNQIARRFLAGRLGSGVATFKNNTYMFDGAFESTTGYDDSGTNIEEDPGFADPANGDFTVSGAAQIANKTGDPRWLP